MTSIDRTAYPRFKRTISAREIADVFTPSAEEIEWAWDKTTTEPNMLALMTWLKSFQYLGYFPGLDELPEHVLAHVRSALGLSGDVRADVDADRTGKRYREITRLRLGVKSDKAASRGVAAAAVRAAAQSKDNPADLINVAIEHLVRKRLELPGYSTLDRMVARIRAKVNEGVFGTVSSRIPADGRARLGRLLVADPATRRSEFDRLKDPARAATIGKLKARLKHLADLDAVGPTGAWLAGVPMAKVGHFAGEARLTDAADMKKTGEAKRLTLLAAMVHTLRVSARDEVTDMFCKRMAIIHRKGRERLEELREAHRAESERLLEVFGDVLAAAREATTTEGDGGEEPAAGPGAVSDADDEQAARRAGVLVLRALESGGGLDRLSTAHEAVAAYHGNNYLPLLERFYKSHRPVLFTLVDALDLQAASAERGVLDAVEFIRANRDRRGEWIEESTTHLRDGKQVTIAIDIDSFASEQWRTTLRDKRRPGLLARRHLEVCVLSHLAAELRSGDIAVAGSDSYASLHDQLMSWEECQPHVADFCEQAGIPASVPGTWSRTSAPSWRRPPPPSMPATRRTPTCAWRAAGRCWPAVRAPSEGRRRSRWRPGSWTGCPSGGSWTSWPAPPI